jgi:hypothetical protein
MKKVKFYKTAEGKWYIYLPEYLDAGGSIEELEMILGADVFLDEFNDGTNTVWLNIGTERFNETCEKLYRSQTEISGGWVYLYPKSPYVGDIVSLWLCGVTAFVFNGEFPLIIYFEQTKENEN